MVALGFWQEYDFLEGDSRMTQGSLERVVVQEFSPEQAGEIVGWFNVHQPQEGEMGEGLTVANVAYARVSSEGAEISFSRYEADGTANWKNKGFDSSVELRIVSDNEQVRDILAYRSPGYPGGRQEQGVGPLGERLHPNEGIDGERGTWVLGGSELLKAIHEAVTTIDQVQLYNAIYYNLALMAEEGNILADPDMHITTQDEIVDAVKYHGRLVTAKRADDTMVRDLTVFGGMRPEDIPEAFRDARLFVARRENELLNIRQKMNLGEWQSPIGSRREWPYMNAMEKDEEKSFGYELKLLQERDVSRANYELEREITELTHRIERAKVIMTRLAILSKLETAQTNDL